MKSNISTVLKTLVTSAIIASGICIGGEGTLPFGKGRPPFSMKGQLEKQRPQQLVIKFNSQGSYSRDMWESSGCPSWLDAYRVSGKIVVEGVIYRIYGVCASEDRLGERIVKGSFGGNTIVLDGLLEKVRQGQVFSGTATVIERGRETRHGFTVYE